MRVACPVQLLAQLWAQHVLLRDLVRTESCVVVEQCVKSHSQVFLTVCQLCVTRWGHADGLPRAEHPCRMAA